MSLTIRRYRPDDADAVWDVHEAAFRASPLTFVEEAAVDEDLFAIEEHYLGRGGEFLVGEVDEDTDGAEIDPGIVAVGGYLPIDEDMIEVKRMRVRPEFQRQGYARKVLDELESRAREAGFETAELETIEPLHAARSFYETAGYDVVERFEQSDPDVERFRYRKPL